MSPCGRSEKWPDALSTNSNKVAALGLAGWGKGFGVVFRLGSLPQVSCTLLSNPFQLGWPMPTLLQGRPALRVQTDFGGSALQ